MSNVTGPLIDLCATVLVFLFVAPIMRGTAPSIGFNQETHMKYLAGLDWPPWASDRLQTFSRTMDHTKGTSLRTLLGARPAPLFACVKFPAASVRHQ